MRRKIIKIFENAATLAVSAAVIVMLGYAISGTPVIAQVEGASMEPGYLSGDAYICAPGWDIGEAAVLNDPSRSRILVKRVVAEGPCRVSWDENGAISVDGSVLYEPYARYGPGSAGECDVPEGYLFVAGDNRHVSYDSRSFGAVPPESVRGKPVLQIRYGSDATGKEAEPDAADP